MRTVTVTYTREVYLPDHHAGKVGDTRDLLERDAIELKANGYVTYTEKDVNDDDAS